MIAALLALLLNVAPPARAFESVASGCGCRCGHWVYEKGCGEIDCLKHMCGEGHRDACERLGIGTGGGPAGPDPEEERRRREDEERRRRVREQRRKAEAEEKQRRERQAQEDFERDKKEALGSLKGVDGDDGGLKGVDDYEPGLKGVGGNTDTFGIKSGAGDDDQKPARKARSGEDGREPGSPGKIASPSAQLACVGSMSEAALALASEGNVKRINRLMNEAEDAFNGRSVDVPCSTKPLKFVPAKVDEVDRLYHEMFSEARDAAKALDKVKAAAKGMRTDEALRQYVKAKSEYDALMKRHGAIAAEIEKSEQLKDQAFESGQAKPGQAAPAPEKKKKLDLLAQAQKKLESARQMKDAAETRDQVVSESQAKLDAIKKVNEKLQTDPDAVLDEKKRKALWAEIDRTPEKNVE